MAITVTQRTSASNAAAATSIGLAYGSNTTAGSLLVALGFNTASTAMSVTDTQNNIWQKLTIPKSQFSAQYLNVWIATADDSAANTVTLTTGFNNSSLHIYEVTGLTSAKVFDAVAVAGQSSATSLSSGNLTAFYNNELIIGAHQHINATTLAWTVGANFSNLISQFVNFNGTMTQERIISSAGAYASVATLAANATNIVSWVLAFSDTGVGVRTFVNNYNFVKAGDGMSVSERIR